MGKIKNLITEDQPRGRLYKLGPSKLALYELIAIILGSGSKNKDVMELAKEVSNFINNSNISDLTLEKLEKIKGIKRAKSALIISAIEIGKRLNKPILRENKFNNINEVYSFFKNELENLNHEKMFLILFDNKKNFLKKIEINSGTSNTILIDQKQIFKTIIDNYASSFMIIHNHPSGDSKPSENDIKSTNLIIEGSKILNISFIDHLIIGKNEFYSFLSRNKIKINYNEV